MTALLGKGKKFVALMGLMSLPVFSQATILLLPSANEMSVGVYNDFNVYSLDLLEQCAAAGDPRCLPSGSYPVQSSPGQIADQGVVLTSSEGYGGNTPSPFSSGSAVDDAFMTPTGAQASTFTMTSGNEPDPTFDGDQVGWWNIGLSLLSGYLGDHELVFLFDNNQQQNQQGGDVYIWAQARIVDANGNIVNNLCFEVSNASTGCTTMDQTPAPDASYFLPVYQGFCVDKVTGESYAATGTGANACNSSDHPSGGYYVKNNLGTNIAEFAAFNQTLNDAVKNPVYGDYFLSIFVSYFGNDGGAEQLWICSECDIPQRVPEPASMLLAGCGLLGLAALRRRKQG